MVEVHRLSSFGIFTIRLRLRHRRLKYLRRLWATVSLRKLWLYIAVKNVAVNARETVPYSLVHPDTMGMDDRDCSGQCSVNGSNESVKFGFKID